MQTRLALQLTDQELILQPAQHVHTLVWLPGVGEQPETALQLLLHSDMMKVFHNFRIVILRPPRRLISLFNKEMTAWFNAKLETKLNLTVPAEEAFDAGHMSQSFERIDAVLRREEKLLKGASARLFFSGFSQGAAMALYTFYRTKVRLTGLFLVSAYLLSNANFTASNTTPKKVVYGLADKARRWQWVKPTFEGKFRPEEIVLVDDLKHEFNTRRVREEFVAFLSQHILPAKL